jgi:hypothetical protein
MRPCKKIGKMALIPFGREKPGRPCPATPTWLRVVLVEITSDSISSFLSCEVSALSAVQAALTTSLSLSSKEMRKARIRSG